MLSGDAKEELARQIKRVLPLPSSAIWIVELCERAHRFNSRGEIRRIIHEGAVSIDGVKITDEKAKVEVKSGMLLKVGKRILVKLEVS